MLREKTTLFSPLILLGLICLLSFTFMLHASLGDSGTMDELAHIPSGYSYVKHLDFRLNPEHPPVVKALAGLPLLFMDLNFPTTHTAWTEDVNGQWEMGAQFLYHSGNDADRIIRWARVGPMLLTILLIVLVYFWARELMGRTWALVPALLVGISPHFLAHGHYVTTDVGAALGIVFATYFFIKYLSDESKKNLVWAGVAFGVAQLLKFSAVLLIPFFGVLIIIHFFLHWAHERARENPRGVKYLLPLCGRLIRDLVVIFFIGGVLVYLIYAPFVIQYPVEKQVADTEFILSSFAGGPTPEGDTCNPMRCLAELDIRMAGNSLTRPAAHYLLGILMVIQRASGGNTAYFLGQVSSTGSHFYFPVVYALKESLPVLIMILAASLGALWRVGKKVVTRFKTLPAIFRDYLTVNFAEFSMLLFVTLYWAQSIQSPLNIGFRHLFPALPFMYILAAGFWRRWISSVRVEDDSSPWSMLKTVGKVFVRSSLKALVLVVLLLWFLGETIAATPHYLSYFNQFGGGTSQGYRYVTDSNYDWGQDLKRLAAWVETRNGDDDPSNNISRIAIDYFGAGNPKYYLGEHVAEHWWSARGNPMDENIEWLAVSVNSLQGAIQPVAPNFERKPEDEYRWLTSWRAPESQCGGIPPPDARAGTSIFLYHLDTQEK